MIYLRDFHADRDAWIAQYSTGKHFEARLAHVHGNLFAFLNVVLGYLLARLPLAPTTSRAISWLGLAGMLMPVGILAEVYLGAPPFFVLIGGAAMLVAVAWFGMAVLMVKAEHASEGTTS
ncbi:MAG: hypothetical protein KC766_16915 [Myxococcales bacterium]|nr:hypothetical protein [Myxococcales bacterium]